MTETEKTPEPTTRREYARALFKKAGHCNCDLDNWEPEASTGHSWVCRIHKAAMNWKPPISAAEAQ